MQLLCPHMPPKVIEDESTQSVFSRIYPGLDSGFLIELPRRYRSTPRNSSDAFLDQPAPRRLRGPPKRSDLSLGALAEAEVVFGVVA